MSLEFFCALQPFNRPSQDSWMYPDPNVPHMGNPYKNALYIIYIYMWVFMGYKL